MSHREEQKLRMALFLEGLREGLAAGELHEFIKLGIEVEDRLTRRIGRRKQSA